MRHCGILSEKGRPTLFITLTCNTHWPEISQRLFPGQSAYEQKDVVCAVFKGRLEDFLFNLRYHYFSLFTVVIN